MIFTLCALALLTQDVPTISIKPTLATASVTDDADDPAIWVNPADASKSLIFGTNKAKAPTGAIFAFNLDGKTVQKIEGLDRPNNCDVQDGFKAGTESWSLLVVTERLKNRLVIYRIGPDGRLADVSGATAVFTSETGERRAPMGISCFRRKDGEVFAIVSPKEGPADRYLGEYRLVWNPSTKRIDTHEARRFGEFSGKKEIESICVDDELGFVYYSDETVGTRKYLAEPEAPGAERQLAFFNDKDTKGDHEGIAIWPTSPGNGYVVCTDQIDKETEYRVFTRTAPHTLVAGLKGPADSTDGIEICAQPLGAKWPKGMLISMNSGPKNFLLFDLAKINIRSASK